MGSKELEAFLTYLAIKENVAASIQNQALSAILFLDREVLRQELDLPVDALRAKQTHLLSAPNLRRKTNTIFPSN